MARFFRALGDPARLRLLEFLLPVEHTVSECVRHIGLSQGRVSAHLACLADCGYVQARRAGRFGATAIYHGMIVDAVSDLDLSYTPPLGSPWDAVQMAAQAWTRATRRH